MYVFVLEKVRSGNIKFILVLVLMMTILPSISTVRLSIFDVFIKCASLLSEPAI